MNDLIERKREFKHTPFPQSLSGRSLWQTTCSVVKACDALWKHGRRTANLAPPIPRGGVGRVRLMSDASNILLTETDKQTDGHQRAALHGQQAGSQPVRLSLLSDSAAFRSANVRMIEAWSQNLRIADELLPTLPEPDR